MRSISLAASTLALCLAAGPGLAAEQSAPAANQESPAPAKQGGAAQSAPAKPETSGPGRQMNAPASVDPNSYILGGDDVVSVRVWREADLSQTVIVRPDGKISMPLVNEVQATGLTPVQLAAAITEALGKFVNNPQVTVSVEAVRSRRYFVDGEVNRPGVYPLATQTTVFEALSMAGGFREFANKKNITIIRGDKRLKFNWNEVIKGRNLSQNILVENGDHIAVQ